MKKLIGITASQNAVRGAVTLALLLAVLLISAQPAAAQQFVYKGHDMTYPNIQMELWVTPGASDATGTIYVGNYNYLVKGRFSGNSLAGTASTAGGNAGAVVAVSVPVAGNLSGRLGVGTILVRTGPMPFNRPIALSFVLYPAGGAAAAPPSPPPPPPPSLPATAHLTGVTGFGYTKVFMTLDLTLRGSSYYVTGTLFVNQLNPTLQQTLSVSGVLTPGVEGALAVTGANAGDSPRFAATLHTPGLRLDGLITGIPSLHITHLYVGGAH